MLHRTYSGKQLLNLKLNGCRYVFCYVFLLLGGNVFDKLSERNTINKLVSNIDIKQLCSFTWSIFCDAVIYIIQPEVVMSCSVLQL